MSGLAAPALTVFRIRAARTRLRRAVGLGASADPQGLTVGQAEGQASERVADLHICPAPYAKRKYAGLPCRVASSALVHQYEIA